MRTQHTITALFAAAISLATTAVAQPQTDTPPAATAQTAQANTADKNAEAMRDAAIRRIMRQLDRMEQQQQQLRNAMLLLEQGENIEDVLPRLAPGGDRPRHRDHIDAPRGPSHPRNADAPPNRRKGKDGKNQPRHFWHKNQDGKNKGHSRWGTHKWDKSKSGKWDKSKWGDSKWGSKSKWGHSPWDKSKWDKAKWERVREVFRLSHEVVAAQKEGDTDEAEKLTATLREKIAFGYDRALKTSEEHIEHLHKMVKHTETMLEQQKEHREANIDKGVQHMLNFATLKYDNPDCNWCELHKMQKDNATNGDTDSESPETPAN